MGFTPLKVPLPDPAPLLRVNLLAIPFPCANTASWSPEDHKTLVPERLVFTAPSPLTVISVNGNSSRAVSVLAHEAVRARVAKNIR